MGVRREVDEAQDQLEAGNRLAVELDDASVLELVAQTLVARWASCYLALFVLGRMAYCCHSGQEDVTALPPSRACKF